MTQHTQEDTIARTASTDDRLLEYQRHEQVFDA